MGEQYIFTIANLSKAYAKREVLKNIWLAFYPGRRSASLAAMGRARARYCGSWRSRRKTSSARHGRPTASASATFLKSLGSTKPRT